MIGLPAVLRNPIGWAVLLVLVVLACASVFSIVPETGQALVVRGGRPLRVVNGFRDGERFGEGGAGLVAHLPLIEQVVLVDRRVRDVPLDRQAILSVDQVRVDVSAFARYRIVDPLRLYLSVRGDDARLQQALRPALAAALRETLGRERFDALLTPDRGGALPDAARVLDRVAARYGVRIVDVQVRRIALPAGGAQDGVIERMRAASLSQAAAVRADGMKQAAAIRSDADAQAARVAADSFGRDPAFYDFYRSMQSYRTTFGVDTPTEGGATIVLPADSGYLRNFAGRTGK